MTIQMIKDYINLLEEEDFLDARHVEYLAMAKEELQKIEEKELVSNCCSAPVDEDYMICPHCFEHCDVVETE